MEGRLGRMLFSAKVHSPWPRQGVILRIQDAFLLWFCRETMERRSFFLLPSCWCSLFLCLVWSFGDKLTAVTLLIVIIGKKRETWSTLVNGEVWWWLRARSLWKARQKPTTRWGKFFKMQSDCWGFLCSWTWFLEKNLKERNLGN